MQRQDGIEIRTVRLRNINGVLDRLSDYLRKKGMNGCIEIPKILEKWLKMKEKKE